MFDGVPTGLSLSSSSSVVVIVVVIVIVVVAATTKTMAALGKPEQHLLAWTYLEGNNDGKYKGEKHAVK